MDEQDIAIGENFPLFSRNKKRSHKPKTTNSAADPPSTAATDQNPKKLDKETDSNPTAPNHISFSDLGLAEWALQTCKELGMKKPTPVQRHCIPRILAGQDVLGIAQTGSGKTAAFALPLLHLLAQDPYGVFALVVTPTRELAYQLAEQFRALGSCLNLRCVEVVGGMDSINQAKTLMRRPHVVIATPGRIKTLLQQNPDIPSIFSKTKFLVLDEADRVLDVGFEEELKVIFQCLPKNRQTLLFSATMTSELQTLLELSVNKAYFYEAYEGFKTVESLKQQYLLTPSNIKEVSLFCVLSKMEDMGIRSAIVFVSTCRTCHFLSLLLEELDLEAAALHSFKSQSLRLSALHKFKSGKVPILLATDVASRGLDIPTVDLVINYDLPRYPRDYVHRVGRTARAGRGGLAASIMMDDGTKSEREIELVCSRRMNAYEAPIKFIYINMDHVWHMRLLCGPKLLLHETKCKSVNRKENMGGKRKNRKKKEEAIFDNFFFKKKPQS
nr:DEAD-box ATP-dependent RNA helicase 36 [Ipomoea batatas]